MIDDSSTIERAVAEFVVGFNSKDIDTEARATAKALIKDQLAIRIGASQPPWSRQLRSFFRKPRSGRSTVVADASTMDAVGAAFLNASYGHGFEYDDLAGDAHPDCSEVPVAMTVATSAVSFHPFSSYGTSNQRRSTSRRLPANLIGTHHVMRGDMHSCLRRQS